MDKTYFLGVLSNINYLIAKHPGNAKQRLASQALHLFRIPIEIIPVEFKKSFTDLRHITRDENKTNPKGMGVTFVGKRNTTIASYIKLLIDIEHQFKF